MKRNFKSNGIKPKNLMSFKVAVIGFKLVLVCLIGTTIGCKKDLQVPAPTTSINAVNVYASNNTAIQVMDDVYARLSSGIGTSVGDLGGTPFLGGVLSDELTLYNVTDTFFEPYYLNALNAADSSVPWGMMYNQLFTCNAVIEGVFASKGITTPVKNQLIGEAKFMRAFYFFYLVNLFGDVPMPLSTDPNTNRLLGRTPKIQVYTQIINDLTDAQKLLSEDFLNANLSAVSEDRVRPTKSAATALLARVYLYMDNNHYADAATQASAVISNSQFSLTDLNSVFLKNSQETIFALQPVVNNPYYNTGEGFYFILSGRPTTDTHEFYLSSFLYSAFEPGDARKSNWVNSVTVDGTTYPYAYKYKAGADVTEVVEYEMVLRLAEQYLIRAEAEARQNDLAGAIRDLNVIRKRARAAATVAVPNPLPDLSASLNEAQVLAAIEHERQVELFTEWGHRWLDLKRTAGFADPSVTRADEVMKTVTPAKGGGAWQPYQKLLPIPIGDINTDPNLKNSQNPGY